MNSAGRDRRIKPGAWTVDQPISENDAIERGIKHLTLEARDAMHSFTIDGVRFGQ